MKKTVLISTLFSIALLFQACSKEKHEDATSANSMVTANEYVLTALDSKQYTAVKGIDGFKVKEFKGKVVIFDIFATWCPPCQAEASHLSSLQKKYKDDLVVIGLTIEDNIPNAKLQTFRSEHNANYILTNSKENRPLIEAIAQELKVGN